MTNAGPKLTLGPVLYNWPADKLRDFYFRIADEAPVDVVYIGEITCSKRVPFFSPYIPEVCERLEEAGKEIVLSSLALIMSARERKELRALTSESPWPIEANDLSAISLLRDKQHVVGPFVNVYNESTLEHFYETGASRVVLSCELPSTSIFELGKAANGRELEIQAFGRLPLALSARCYHARSHNLSKDGCQYVCELDPDGMDVRTLDGTPFLAVNGTQTMSYTVNSLLGELNHLKDIGVTHFRLWPHDMDMVEVARIFQNVLDNHEDSERAIRLLQELVTIAPLSNGFFHNTEGFRMVE
ncbi:MAG: U32 family peptidase [Sneathiella sp.]|nr:U32 family peptidase [Sneathiella sp.]